MLFLTVISKINRTFTSSFVAQFYCTIISDSTNGIITSKQFLFHLKFLINSLTGAATLSCSYPLGCRALVCTARRHVLRTLAISKEIQDFVRALFCSEKDAPKNITKRHFTSVELLKRKLYLMVHFIYMYQCSIKPSPEG